MKIMLDYITNFRFALHKTHPVDEAIKLLNAKSPYITHDQMNVDENVINFKNGILDLNTMQLLPHSPKLLSTIQIPVNYTGVPTQTPNFDNFIQTLTEGNKGYAKLIFQYMGAVLSNVYGYRFKKALFLQGKGDTGKSLISSLLSEILGDVNSSERSLKRLGERFGETAVYMKRLVYSADMKIMALDQLDRFKELTGGDVISLEFKSKDPFEYRFRGLMLFATNELPKFGGDKGKHVYDRMMIIRCDNVIPPEKRDKKLIKKLLEEKEGIVFKCVQALLEVINNNYNFTIPNECVQNTQDYMVDNSSVVEFWKEHMEKRDKGDSDKQKQNELIDLYRFWNEKVQGNKFTPNKKEILKELVDYLQTPQSELFKRFEQGYCCQNWKLNEQGLNLLGMYIKTLK
jgi:P4 family phage/plasmid primase-like protien